MKKATLKIIVFAAATAGFFALNSCCKSCCTGVLPAPPLDPVPDFRPLYPTKGK